MEVPLERIGNESNATVANQSTGRLGWWVLVGIAVAVFALDQWTKSLVVQNLAPMGPGYYLPVLGDFVGLAYSTNTGAAFGMFADRTLFLTILAVAAIPALILFQNYLPVGGWTAKICVGLLLGGTFGNLADRLRQGYVVDFVSAGFGDLRWPSFNVADSSFVIGILLLLAFAILFPQSTTSDCRESRPSEPRA